YGSKQEDKIPAEIKHVDNKYLLKGASALTSRKRSLSNIDMEKLSEKKAKIHDTRARKAQKVADNSIPNNTRFENQEQSLSLELSPEYANTEPKSWAKSTEQEYANKDTKDTTNSIQNAFANAQMTSENSLALEILMEPVTELELVPSGTNSEEMNKLNQSSLDNQVTKLPTFSENNPYVEENTMHTQQMHAAQQSRENNISTSNTNAETITQEGTASAANHSQVEGAPNESEVNKTVMYTNENGKNRQEVMICSKTATEANVVDLTDIIMEDT
ncbi:10373_t:CDS:2, partial [Scutellospora calospora]